MKIIRSHICNIKSYKLLRMYFRKDLQELTDFIVAFLELTQKYEKPRGAGF